MDQIIQMLIIQLIDVLLLVLQPLIIMLIVMFVSSIVLLLDILQIQMVENVSRYVPISQLLLCLTDMVILGLVDANKNVVRVHGLII